MKQRVPVTPGQRVEQLVHVYRSTWKIRGCRHGSQIVSCKSLSKPETKSDDRDTGSSAHKMGKSSTTLHPQTHEASVIGVKIRAEVDVSDVLGDLCGEDEK